MTTLSYTDNSPRVKPAEIKRLTQAEHLRRLAELPAIIADLREARLELAARQAMTK